ncbi:MAG: hypothetical protein ACR2N1_03920 [Rubripirellula sp.]
MNVCPRKTKMCLKQTLPRFVAVCTLLLLGLPCSVVPSFGQCCGGAQNSVTHSHDGRFRVEAVSLTGTGHSSHGPYKFRFRTLRIDPNGEAEEIGVFERVWDTDKHFGMTVCVSPTGNGFALGSNLEDPILFFSPTGTILAKIDKYLSLEIHCRRKGDSPLMHPVSARTQYGRRTTKLWLPLFHISGPETQWISDQRPNVVVKKHIGLKTVQSEEVSWLLRMLKWRPDVGGREASRVQELIAKSDQAGLVELGLSSLAPVEAKLSAEEQPFLRRVQQEIVRRLCGHQDAWRNLDLLVALCEYPNTELRECAEEQLRALLPDGKATADWVHQNRQHLKWDAKLNTYRR